MKKSSSRRRVYLQGFMFAVLLFLFYQLNFPIYYIVLIGIAVLLLILLKGRLYKKMDDFLINRFSFLSKQKVWVRKLIVISLFILIYVLLKQIIFFILKQFGIDVQQMIMGSINQSAGKWISLHLFWINHFFIYFLKSWRS